MRRITLPAVTAASVALTPRQTPSNSSDRYDGGAPRTQQANRTIKVDNITINVAALDGKGKDEIVNIVQDALLTSVLDKSILSKTPLKTSLPQRFGGDLEGVIEYKSAF